MDDSEKPFACPSPGCNMSFTNEDHLVVHRKKHDMVLNLGANGKNSFVADQTPTPTRFIRNCEEVGLFQDLQNVNPFEETFRRAVEDGKTVALSESEGGGSDDTLHTPHIFPNIAEPTELADSEKSKEISSAGETNNSGEQRVTVACEPSTNKPEVEIVASKKPAIGGIVVRAARTFVAPKIIEASRAATNLSINGQEVQLLLKTSDGKLVQLSAMPVSESRNDPTIEPRVICPKSDEPKKIAASDDRLTIAKMRLKQTLTKNNASCSAASRNTLEGTEKSRNSRTSREKSSVASTSEQRRKQDVLARNRASSMRARAKRKAWIQQLQKIATSANERNATLQLEVKALRSEVAKLRALLLAHEDCSVTRSIGKGTPIAVQESKTPSIVRALVHNSVNTSSVMSSRRRATVEARSETPIAPKVPKLLANNASATVILPKSSETIGGPSGYVIRDLSSLRIVDVRTIASETDTSSPRRILLVDNSNTVTTATRMITNDSTTRTNPSTLQIENAASKCTGT